MVTIDLPEDLRGYVQAMVLRGRFASEDAVIAEAVRVLRQTDQGLRPFPKGPLTEEAFDQHLVEIGLMSKLPPPSDPARPQRDFRPVAIAGEPLSETINRERR
jgi:hypothetical protein